MAILGTSSGTVRTRAYVSVTSCEIVNIPLDWLTVLPNDNHFVESSDAPEKSSQKINCPTVVPTPAQPPAEDTVRLALAGAETPPALLAVTDTVCVPTARLVAVP